jgi:hypothetical protein
MTETRANDARYLLIGHRSPRGIFPVASSARKGKRSPEGRTKCELAHRQRHGDRLLRSAGRQRPDPDRNGGPL